VAERAGVRRVSLSEAEALARPDRTVYRVDVRTAEEYAKAHLPGFANVPGGQLVQETDHTAPVRGALILLSDDDGIRADMTASWLAQMGWETYVIEPGPLDRPGGTAEPQIISLPASSVPEVSPDLLHDWQAQGSTAVIDVTTSANYVKGHIPGAWFVLRSQLQNALQRVGAAQRYVVTCGTGALAQYAVQDLQALTSAEVFLLTGGTLTWTSSGLPLTSGEERLASPRIDRYWRPYEGTDAPREAMESYLEWEYGLVEQLNRDGTHFFSVI
jgi:rhodanese-related sulfurtransferase